MKKKRKQRTKPRRAKAVQSHRRTKTPPPCSEKELHQFAEVNAALTEAGLLNQEHNPSKLKSLIEDLHLVEKQEYHGESYGKKIARFAMYQVVYDLWGATKYPGGWAITLAGPEAPETGLIQAALDWNHAKTIYVDRKQSCVLEAQLRAPASMCAHGDLTDVLQLLKGKASIGFIHLDFMGHITDSIYECVKQLGPLLRPGAVVLFTYLRGRETDKNTRWLAGKDLAAAWLKSKETITSRRTPEDIPNDIVRYNAHSITLTQALGKPNGEVQAFWGATYQSGSPMGIVALQYMPRGMQDSRWRMATNQYVRNRPHMRKFINDEAAFREIIINARRKGSTALALSMLFAIPKAKVAAWLAHDTMGTYRKKTA